MARVEVIPFAVFNCLAPIVVAVRVLKGPLVRQMTVCVELTQKVLGTIVNIQKDNQEVLEGSVGGVYAIRIDPIGEALPILEKADKILVCSV